jgi:hypothetical protein
MFDFMNKAVPFINASMFRAETFTCGNKNHVSSLLHLQKPYTSENKSCLLVHKSSILKSMWQLMSNCVLVGWSKSCIYKVKQNNDHEELIENPKEPNKTYHKPGGVHWLSSLNSLIPIFITRSIDISNRISVSLQSKFEVIFHAFVLIAVV